MNILDLLVTSLNMFFLIFSIVGILSSIILFFFPAFLFRFDKMLNKRFYMDTRGLLIDARIDIEYIFFNNHKITALMMILFSGILIAVNRMVELQKVEPGIWLILIASLKYFFIFFAYIGALYGLFLLIDPRRAFLFLRKMNQTVCSVTTDEAEVFLESAVIEKKVYIKYHMAVAVIMFLFSLTLLVLLCRPMFS